MALNKATLAQQLKTIFDGVSPEATGITDPALLRQKLANDMADAIDAFVKTGTVTVAKDIPVSTTGTAAAQTGKTITTGTGTIS
jgi:hypothetical protein